MSDNNVNRRTVLRAATMGSIVAGVPVTVTGERGENNQVPDRVTLDELAIEIAFHPEDSVAAITTLGLGDGYQVYLVKNVESRGDTVHTERDLTQLSDADIGVHGVHWTDSKTIKHSQDEKVLTREVDLDSDNSPQKHKTVVDDSPLPVRPQDGVTPQVDIPYPIDCKDGGNVCCTDLPFVTDWCVRVTGDDDGHSPECEGHNPPPMPHGHFAIYKETDYRDSGFNIWIGRDGNCIWVGEETRTNWCEPVCGPEDGLPSLSDLRDAYEEAINKAADAAGIALPAIAVTALAYYLAASTVAPPAGVPLI